MNTIIIYSFTKQEIESLDFHRFDGLFNHWPQLWSRELREKMNCLTLTVNGYDDHPDEIYLIPEVRVFFKALHERWPWWAFFLCIETNTLPLSYLCLLDSVISMKSDGAADCAASFDPRELVQFLRHDFSRMNYLMGIAGFTEAEIDARTESIFKATGVPIHE